MNLSSGLSLPDAPRLLARREGRFQRRARQFQALLRAGYTTGEALRGPSFRVGRNVAPDCVHFAVPPTRRPDAATAPPPTPCLWAVIVLGYDKLLPNIAPVFEFCVRRLGRSRVILLANVEEQHQTLMEAARTGYPVFSDSFSNEENKSKKQAQLHAFRQKFSFIFAHGGADYDFERCNAATLMNVLHGTRTLPGDKVVPNDTSAHSVFVCLNGHGDSSRCLPRSSPRLEHVPCDLCQRPHARRPGRDVAATAMTSSAGASQFLEWIIEECLTPRSKQTMSNEDDRNLDEGDRVLTPVGLGTVLRAKRRAIKYPLPLLVDHRYASPSSLWSSYTYDVLLDAEANVAVRRAQSSDPRLAFAGDPVWRKLSLLQSISGLTKGRIQCSCFAANSMEAYLTETDIRCLFIAGIQRPGRLTVLKHCRRDFLTLAVGPRKENHYHSSLLTREWYFGMLHEASHEQPASSLSSTSDPFAFVASRYAGTEYRCYFFWQQLFQSLHAIRKHSPACKILCVMESCYSGGCIKFLKDPCRSWFNHLKDWPIFLIATAGESQTSLGGIFLPAFLRNIQRRLAESEQKDGDSDGACSLWRVYRDTADEYQRKNRPYIEAALHKPQRQACPDAVRLNHQINISFSEGTGVHEEHIGEWFGRA